MTNELTKAKDALATTFNAYQAAKEAVRVLMLEEAPVKIGDVVTRVVHRRHRPVGAATQRKPVTESYRVERVSVYVDGASIAIRSYWGVKRLAAGDFGAASHELHGLERGLGDSWQKET
jgi:hypothetical protein